MHFVSASCRGERCSMCGVDATHKVGEEILHDDPNPIRHNLTAYVCCCHFSVVMRTDCGGQEEELRDADICQGGNLCELIEQAREE